MYFGAITFTSWFRLECFAVYASSPLLPPEMQDSLRRGLAVPFYGGTYTLKISAALPSAPFITFLLRVQEIVRIPMCHRRMAALTLLMKHIRQRDLMELLDKLPLLMVERVSDEQVRVLSHYMVNAGDSPSPEFMRALAARLPQHEDKLMTIAERLEQKGRQEGAAEKAQAIA